MAVLLLVFILVLPFFGSCPPRPASMWSTSHDAEASNGLVDKSVFSFMVSVYARPP